MRAGTLATGSLNRARRMAHQPISRNGRRAQVQAGSELRFALGPCLTVESLGLLVRERAYIVHVPGAAPVHSHQVMHDAVALMELVHARKANRAHNIGPDGVSLPVDVESV